MKRKAIILLMASMILTFGSVGTVFAAEPTTQSAKSTVHEHVWGNPYYVVDKEAEYKWVTVIDTPEQTVKYSIYKMYWYTTGTWEETRDPDRFNVWYKSEDGGLYPLLNPYAKPEDNPLFIEYDSNGNPTYINDHTISGPYYETIPAVTHEEYQEISPEEGHNEYKCSLCGEIQNSDTGEVIKPGTITQDPTKPDTPANPADTDNADNTGSTAQDNDKETQTTDTSKESSTADKKQIPQTGDTMSLISIAALAGSAVTGGTAIRLRRKIKK